MDQQQADVLAFHKKYGCLYNDKPTDLAPEVLLLRSRLIVEEAAEFVSAASQNDMVGMVDAITDLLYVTYGAAVCLGVDIEPCFKEVQKSNMTKDGGGKDSAGKIKKGPDFQEPDLLSIIQKQGWADASKFTPAR